MTELTLRDMSEAEYEAFITKLIAEYAAVNVEAGNWRESEALEMSKKACEKLLPEGLQTPRVLLLSAQNAEGEYVGYLWIGLDRPGSPGSGWIYDIEVAENNRGKGYGRELLRAAEAETLKHGVGILGLNVFGTNKVARKLYESAGYSISQIAMSKKLGAEEDFQ
jgi:ribosomal protein S18 acetylase RimI-like enzyme